MRHQGRGKKGWGPRTPSPALRPPSQCKRGSLTAPGSPPSIRGVRKCPCPTDHGSMSYEPQPTSQSPWNPLEVSAVDEKDPLSRPLHQCSESRAAESTQATCHGRRAFRGFVLWAFAGMPSVIKISVLTASDGPRQAQARSVACVAQRTTPAHLQSAVPVGRCPAPGRGGFRPPCTLRR